MVWRGVCAGNKEIISVNKEDHGGWIWHTDAGAKKNQYF
jgi:hypothetical protein